MRCTARQLAGVAVGAAAFSVNEGYSKTRPVQLSCGLISTWLRTGSPSFIRPDRGESRERGSRARTQQGDPGGIGFPHRRELDEAEYGIGGVLDLCGHGVLGRKPIVDRGDHCRAVSRQVTEEPVVLVRCAADESAAVERNDQRQF